VTHRKTMTIHDAVEAALDGKSTVVLCPAHSDEEPSLSVSPGSSQPVVFHCHAGCEQGEIIAAGELDWAKVCAPLGEGQTNFTSDRWTPVGEASHVWGYYDEQGTLLFEVLRVPLPGGKKRIMQRRPDPHAPHGRSWNLEGVRRVLYRLPQVIEAVSAGRTIHVTEGEKCADALQRVLPEGDVATTNPQGAGKWYPEFSEALSGATVVVYADSDDTGRGHARDVREMCVAEGCRVTVKEAPAGRIAKTGAVVNDVADHLEAGFTLDQLLETSPEEEVEKARTGFDILDVILRPLTDRQYVIDNTFAKGERLVLIGFEGQGKSTLCRQMAVMCAAGIHPFTGLGLECGPQRVLFIDAENHPEQTQESWVQMVGLAKYHGFEIERGQLTVLEEWAGGRDLTSPAGSAWLHERVYAYRPDLVVMGPATNLADRDLRDDEPVRKIKLSVDKARAICNSAFIIEHHAPLKGSVDKERPLRPYGSSLFLKWPDFGYGIKPTDDPKVFEWHKTRGPRMRRAQWPEALREGRENSVEWPWMPTILTNEGAK
jgi:hypothetical protein